VIHATYVDDLLIEDATIEKASSDGLDLEFSKVELKRVQILDSGDDGLDLMGSDVDLLDSQVVGCKNNGISSGEQSEVTVRNSLVARARVGVLAKNASTVDLYGSLLFKNQTGIEVYQRTVRFEGNSKVKADVLYVVDSKREINRDDLGQDRLDVGRVMSRIPRRGMLEHLAQNVLGLESWEHLAVWSKKRAQGGLK